MNIDHLHSEELDYELNIRGYPSDGTVAEKRRRARTALRLEKDGAAFTPVSLLDPEEEIGICDQKVTELKDAVDNFNFDNAANEYKRFRSRLLHLLGRLNRVISSDVSSQKGRLLVKCSEISDFLEESVLLLDPIQIPNMPTCIPTAQNESSASSMNDAAANQSSETRGKMDQGRNSSLLDVSPEELESEINHLQLNCPAQSATTPVTQSIVTTLAGSHTTSSANHLGCYRSCYVPEHQSSGLLPQVSYPGFVPPPAGPVTLPPQYNQSVPQPESRVNCSQEVPTVPTSYRRVNFMQPQVMGGVTSGTQPNNWVRQGDQARVFKIVSQWNIKYDGMSSINNFLGSIEELRVACGFSKDQLMGVAVILFGGVALDWFRANISSSHCWDDLTGLLKEAFLPVEYEEDLWTDIRLRTQGQCERTMAFVAVMQNLFSRLSERPNEHTRLRIIRRNLLPHIQGQLALSNFNTISELLAACQRIEDAQVRAERFKPPPTNPNLVTEQALMYNPRRYRTAVHSVQAILGVAAGEAESLPTASASAPVRHSSRVVCWNCRQTGHVKRSCPNPPTRHCFGCGEPGVIRQSCPRCSGNAQPAP